MNLRTTLNTFVDQEDLRSTATWRALYYSAIVVQISVEVPESSKVWWCLHWGCFRPVSFLGICKHEVLDSLLAFRMSPQMRYEVIFPTVASSND